MPPNKPRTARSSQGSTSTLLVSQKLRAIKESNYIPQRQDLPASSSKTNSNSNVSKAQEDAPETPKSNQKSRRKKKVAPATASALTSETKPAATAENSEREPPSTVQSDTGTGRNKDTETIKQTQPDISSTQEEQLAKKTQDHKRRLDSLYQDSPKDVKATCKYCKTGLEGKSINGTNHLWCHLDRCASYITKNKHSLLKLVANKSGSQAALWVFCQQTSRKILIKMIIAQKHPFTFVKQPLSKAFVGSLQPRFKLFSRATIKNNIMKLFDTMKGKLLADIAKVNCVALTTDLWTSSNQSPYMVVSCHYVSNDWTLQKRLISFKELPSPHTGLAIAEQLISTIVEWKIINKVTFITVDNASSNNVAVTCLSLVLESCST
ncbi:hypothetical protein PCANC_01852 [Puccinia coronata f. sp. avenae]|uniref:BED-type domain-containing protein n=1 Tax=Puccinia coronata f. sp. avenae TaxID=200324 RepID=A0A2N5W5A9_9BASI|nr:hypothetical protein PCANC_01852 [Puccinia coronata f. sp. avenae]